MRNPSYHFSLRKNQTGVALITVMLVIALCAIIAAQMTARLQVQIQRSENIQLNQQAYWYAMGAEAFAKRVILFSAKDEPDVTHLGQRWAEGQQRFPVDFGEISGEIKDLQACFNLNALRSVNNRNQNKTETNTGSNINQAKAAFKELIINLNINGVSEFEADYMADSLADWLDKDDIISSAGGAEDNDYASREFPYLAANSLLASVNELRLIEHFTVQVINALKPYVCVIPESDVHQININTLAADKPELLQALLKVSLDEASNILSAREPEGFKDITEFYNLPEVNQVPLTENQKQQFVIDSEYFTLSSTASFNGSFITLNSIFKVSNNKDISVISRTIGRIE